MDIKILEKARATIIEMLIDRGYEVPLEIRNISRENVEAMWNNNNVNILVSKPGTITPPETLETLVDVEEESQIAEDDAEPADVVGDDAESGAEDEDVVTGGAADVEEDDDDDEDEDDEDEDEDEDEEDDGAVAGGADIEAADPDDDEEEDDAEVKDEADIVITVDNAFARILPYSERGGAHADQAYVYFHIANSKFDKKKMISQVTKIKDTYKSNSISIIFVIKDITHPVQKEADKEAYRNVELFYYNDLQANKSHSIYVPRHELLSEEESGEVAKRYLLSPEEFYEAIPKIFTTDPMAKYFGLREGDICRIHRKSPVNGEAVAYRAVIRPIRE